MNAGEIREYAEQHIKGGHVPPDLAAFRMLSEIAAQLAEYNERAARAEPFAMKVAEKSLAMMERTEKACDELDRKTKRKDGTSKS